MSPPRRDEAGRGKADLRRAAGTGRLRRAPYVERREFLRRMERKRARLEFASTRRYNDNYQLPCRAPAAQTNGGHARRARYLHARTIYIHARIHVHDKY